MQIATPDITRAAVEVAEWYSRSRYRDVFRTSALRPRRELFVDNDGVISVAHGDECTEIVNDVVNRRRRLLADLGWSWNGQPLQGYRGRLLIFHHELSLIDGAAEDLSGGLFDVYNQPPWDTWVAYVQGVDYDSSALVSWIPSELMPAADRGVFANAEQCIQWLGDG